MTTNNTTKIAKLLAIMFGCAIIGSVIFVLIFANEPLHKESKHGFSVGEVKSYDFIKSDIHHHGTITWVGSGYIINGEFDGQRFNRPRLYRYGTIEGINTNVHIVKTYPNMPENDDDYMTKYTGSVFKKMLENAK